MSRDLEKMKERELQALILTPDGIGEDAKREVLAELVDRAFDNGYSRGYNKALDETPN